TGVVSPGVVALAEGALRGMLLTKMKIATAVFLGVALGLVAVLPALLRRAEAAAPPSPSAAATRTADSPGDDQPEPVEFAANNALVLLGGDQVAFGVGFSPDGKRIAAGMGSRNQPGRVEVWDFATRKLLWSQDEARGVSSVAFSADSQRLAWSGWLG